MGKKENISISQSNYGIGFTGLLTIVFIALKLLNIINWSWIWVLAPLWINIVAVIVIWLVVLLLLKCFK